MKRRISNPVLAASIGFIITIVRLPIRISDFTPPIIDPIDAGIVDMFGFTGAIIYHVIFGTLTWFVIVLIILVIFRRKPKIPAEKQEPPSNS